MHKQTAFLFCAMAWAIAATASPDEGVVERAVPAPSTQLQQVAPAPGRAIPAITLEQQLAALQQQVQSLTAQVAALQSVLKVTPTGATLQAPTLSLQSLNGTTIQSNKAIAIQAGTSIDVRSSTNTSIRAASTALIEASGTLELKGAITKFNGGSKPLATVGSQVQVPGQPIGQIVTGTPTLLGN